MSAISDEEHAALDLLHSHGWTTFKPHGPSRRPSAIATPAKGSIALVLGHVLAEFSPFDAEELGRDLVELAESTIAHPDYPAG